MNVLMIEPGKAPYVTDIGNDLNSMQQAVGEMCIRDSFHTSGFAVNCGLP